MNTRPRLLGLAVAIGAAVLGGRPLAGVQSDVVQLLPVDEAVRQPEFFSFRAALQAAIARRDTVALLAVVHPQIKASFGGDDGIDDFRRLWGLDGDGGGPSDGSSDIWTELGTVLALGGSFSGDETFVAPYTYSAWPGLDAFEHVVLTAAEVPIRSAPRADAPVLRSMDFAILQLARSAAASDTWTAVELEDGRTAYVRAAVARSPIDYRAIFSRESGRWQLAMFLAGD